MEWLARSAHPEKGQSAQPYARHVLGSLAYVRRFLRPLSPVLAPAVLKGLFDVLVPAQEFHDLGKLEDSNQDVLSGKCKGKTLPIRHQDAGVAHLLALDCLESAVLVASHHAGLPDFVEEFNRGDDAFRESDASKRMQAPLDTLLERHREALSAFSSPSAPHPPENLPEWQTVFWRMALSCLVDADHSDSSAPNIPLEGIGSRQLPPLLPERRLKALDAYVSRFGTDSERSALRGAIYASCRDQLPGERIVACDSPVGSGKTTAVMAHLLAVARERGLRRVFVVLPFTNIIRQSADVYRKALVLPGENHDEIVAEVHHLADFADESARDFAVRWNAPIVVTTAVAFFGTLAAASPVSLRRLHELAGSAVFVDEAHAALPAKYLPLSWQWMQAFADDWNVHWVLASGSLVHFWKLPEIRDAGAADTPSPERVVPFLSAPAHRDAAAAYEKTRVRFETVEKALTVETLRARVASTPGPQLIILNTVQNAALVARDFARSNAFETVFHLSTALSPEDRAHTLEAVKKRLDSDRDGNWVLVGTSCIEAGMDLDFATGFREMASLASLLQASGRINREGKRIGTTMFSFHFAVGNGINENPGLADAVTVLRQLLLDEKRPVSADLCTEALRRELKLDPSSESSLSRLPAQEGLLNFREVEKKFKIIDADTRTVVVDPDLAARIESFQPVDWREIQRRSVQLWGYKIEQLHVPEIAGRHGCFKWHLDYSPFLGCMEGILACSEFIQAGGGVL